MVIAAPAPSAYHQFRVKQLVGRLDRGIGQGDTDPAGAFRTAQPIELGRIEFHRRDLEQRLARRIAADHAEGGTILGRQTIEIVGAHELAAARHVLGQKTRLARQFRHHMAADEAAPDIVFAARFRRDDQAHLLVLIELLDRLRARGLKRQEGGCKQNGARSHG